MSAVTLALRNVSKTFGGLTAVEDVAFDLGCGEILGVIGPNGAGKTTTFNLIAGALTPSSGEILLNGARIDGLAPDRIARAGIIRTFQHNAPFVGMSVLDNVMTGAHLRLKAPLWKVALGLASVAAAEAEAREEALGLLDEVGLPGSADRAIAELSFGQGRLLEIARALMGRPTVMLFDEPAAGLTPPEVLDLSRLIRAIAGRGISVLLIEHDMRFLLPLVDRAVVLNFGRKIADSPPHALRANAAVVDAYLGAVG